MSSPALELGTLIHAALADWTTIPTIDADAHFARHATARIDQLNKSYIEHRGDPLSDIEMLPMSESIELGLAMCENYQARWKQPLGDNFVFASPEQQVVVDIPGTEHYCESCYKRHNNRMLHTDVFMTNAFADCTTCNGTGTVRHQLISILDGLIRDNKDTHLILERKTYSRRPNLDDLEMNDQFMGYMWVCKQLGVPNIGGVAYDGLWKRKAPPKGSTLNDLFIRSIIKFYPQEIDDWGKQLANVTNEMFDNPIIYPNRRWEGCNYDCNFVRLCQSESRGEDIDTLIRLNYVQRESNRPVMAKVGATNGDDE